MKTEKNKTIFILDTMTGNVLSSITTKESVNIPFSMMIEFNILKDKIGTVVIKEWLEGESNSKIIIR